MASASSGLRGIYFETTDPSQPGAFTRDVAAECFGVGVAAFTEELGDAQKARAVMGGDVDTFWVDHQNLHRKADDGRLNPQQLTDPRLVIARADYGPHAGEVVGFASSLNAVTNERKGQIRVGRWLYLELTATHPDFWERGIAHGTGYLSLRRAVLLQPASGYTYPTEGRGSGAQLLTSWKMTDDGPNKVQEAHPYGPEGPKVAMHRHSNRLALGVAWRIGRQAQARDPFFRQHMDQAVHHR
jgi:hypothetical protein